MTADPAIRVAMLGAGYFSRFHVDGWTRLAQTDLVGVCDHDEDRASATGAPVFTDFREMLDKTRPDLLDVVVPPVAQAQLIRTAMDAGLRWIICQKPFCTGLGEARDLVAAAAATGTTLVIHENFRFQPWYRAAKAVLESGRIGTVLQAAFRLRPGDGQGGKAYLDRQPYFRDMDRFLMHETGVHFIDTFRYLFGDPTAVYADLRRVNPVLSGEDAGIAIFEHPGGVRAIFDGNRLLDHATDNTRRTMGEAMIEGTEGTLRIDGAGVLWLRRFGTAEETELLGPDRSDQFGGDCVHALQAHVIAAMRGRGHLENPARDYLKVIEIEEALYASARSRERVSL